MEDEKQQEIKDINAYDEDYWENKIVREGTINNVDYKIITEDVRRANMLKIKINN